MNDELIRKQAMLHAIEKCHKKCCRTDSNGDEWIHYETALNELEALPPANTDLIQKIEEGIKATGTADEYSVGMCNGMKWCKSLLDDKAPEYDIVPQKYKKRRR